MSARMTEGYVMVTRSPDLEVDECLPFKITQNTSSHYDSTHRGCHSSKIGTWVVLFSFFGNKVMLDDMLACACTLTYVTRVYIVN